MFLSTLVLFLPLAAQTAPAPAAYPPLPAGVTKDTVSYAQYQETQLDVFTPTGGGDKRPGAIVIHGGGWVNGTKEARWENFVRRYLEKGFVVANVEYRLAKTATAPAAVEDVLKAAEWFVKNAKKYGADPKKIVVTGDSAGGHLALMVGMANKSAKLGNPVKVAAVVNFYGITDVADQLGGENLRPYAVTWVPDGPGRLELAARVSPMNYVRKDLPAILTLHGDSDQTVPYDHGVRLTRALVDAGAKAEMISVPQGRHGFPKEKLDQLYPQIFEFLKRQGIGN